MKKRSLKPKELTLTKIKVSKLDRLDTIFGGGGTVGTGPRSIATQNEDIKPLLP